MIKTTVLELNKPASGDYAGHWDIPLNENADLIDAEFSSLRSELIGSSATPITGLLKGSTASLAARLAVGLNADGTIDFNSGDLEKSRYSGLDYDASFLYDDIHRRIESIEKRLMVADSIQGTSSDLRAMMNRWLETGMTPGAQGSLFSPNMTYLDKLTITANATNVTVAVTGGSPNYAEFLIGGNYYNLTRTTTTPVSPTGKGILYAEVPSSAIELYSAIANGSASYGSSVFSIGALAPLADLADVDDGMVLEVTYTGVSPNPIYRYKIRSTTNSTITIYGKFQRGFMTASTSWRILAVTEPKFTVKTLILPVDITDPSEGSPGDEFFHSSMLYDYDYPNYGINRVPIAYIDGTTVHMYNPRIVPGQHVVHWGSGSWNGVDAYTIGGHLLDMQPKLLTPFIIIKDNGTVGHLNANVIFNPVELQTNVLHPAFAAYLTKDAAAAPNFVNNFSIRVRRGSTGSMLLLVGDDETVEIGNAAGSYSWGVIVSY